MEHIRYFQLKNAGAFVARMIILWSAVNGEKGEFKPEGYNDICAAAERGLDLNNTRIPNGSIVRLKVYVAAGYDKTSQEFIYENSCGNTAKFEISGTTLINKLRFKGM